MAQADSQRVALRLFPRRRPFAASPFAEFQGLSTEQKRLQQELRKANITLRLPRTSRQEKAAALVREQRIQATASESWPLPSTLQWKPGSGQETLKKTDNRSVADQILARAGAQAGLSESGL